MSDQRDQLRSEARAAARRERAKAQLRLEMLVIRADAEGITTARGLARFLSTHRHEFALPVEIRPLGYRTVTAAEVRRWLGLEPGSPHRAAGRRPSREAMEARP